MYLEKHFDVTTTPEAASQLVAQDDALAALFPDAKVEIVAVDGPTRTVRTHYRALGQEGTATFHFTFEDDGDIGFEKVCDGRVWKKLEGSVCFAEHGKGKTRVTIEMDGATKALVPEFTIKGPMQDQIEQMAAAMRERIESEIG